MVTNLFRSDACGRLCKEGTFDEMLRSADDLTMGQSDGRRMELWNGRPRSSTWLVLDGCVASLVYWTHKGGLARTDSVTRRPTWPPP